MTETLRLSLSPKDIAKAAEILERGGLVAFPTETVYGLGADACSGSAVARIFEAKNRPSFNPLIAHVADLSTARAFGRFSDDALRLATAFWPGPLTLVVPVKEKSGLSSLTTAGLDTVGLRVPEHRAAQALLQAFGGPVAAPSANISGKVSPTTAAHVLEELDGKIDAVLDDGPCEVGVESTIIGFKPEPVLLRPGGLPVEAVEDCLGGPVDVITPVNDATPNAPGQLSSHYAPRASVRLNADTAEPGEVFLGFGKVEGATLNLSESGDLTEAAANLFAHLRTLDAEGARSIAVSPIPNKGLGRAINDRLRRAAAPRE